MSIRRNGIRAIMMAKNINGRASMSKLFYPTHHLLLTKVASKLINMVVQQLTSRSPHFLSDFEVFCNKRNDCPGIRTPDLLHMKPVCYHSAMATSYVEGLKVELLNHLKFSQVSTFLSEINKAISYFIDMDDTLVTS